MQLDLNQLRDLLASLNQTDISELTLKGENFELVVRRGPLGSAGALPPVAAEGGVAPERSLVASPAAPPPLPTLPAPAAAPPPSASTPAPSATPNWVEVKSPMVGTFYRAPAPAEPPFVSVGDRVRVGQTVCIIEAMKLMNELEVEVAGEIVEILLQNGQPVEFDQPLMRIVPNA